MCWWQQFLYKLFSLHTRFLCLILVTLKALAAIQVSLMWRSLAIHPSLTVLNPVNQSLPLVIVDDDDIYAMLIATSIE